MNQLFQMFPEISLVTLAFGVIFIQRFRHTKTLAGGVMIIFLGVLLKKFSKNFRSILGDYVIMRPKGAFACNGASKAKCDDEVGMPSIHSMMAGYYAAKFQKHRILLVFLLLVPISRLSSDESPIPYIHHGDFGCHTIPQIIIGFCIGLLIGQLHN